MKTKLVESIMALLVVACALVPLVAATASGQTAQMGTLRGTWDMRITLTDCAGHAIRSFPSLVEFVTGGTVVESNAGAPQATKTPGEGVWRLVADHTYAFSFKSFRFDAQNVYIGWSIIAGTTTVNSTGDANSGSATVKFYDPNGVLLDCWHEIRALTIMDLVRFIRAKPVCSQTTLVPRRTPLTAAAGVIRLR